MEFLLKLFWLLFSVILLIYNCNANNITRFPALLVFGDSTSDTGNNNYIPATLLKPTYYPYGKDFPSHIPTGRFSNGMLIPDMLVSSLGIKDTIPPFLQPHLSDDELITGVTFASAGSGYDDFTADVPNAIPVLQQIKYFKSYIERLKNIAGEEEARKILNGALVYVNAGTNDFIISYYDSQFRKSQFTIDGYQDYILNRLQNFVKELYDLGCRRFLISGLSPIGCLPVQIYAKFKQTLTRTCVENENSDAKVYNKKLFKLLSQIEASLQGTRITYADIYTPIMDMIKYPQKYGFNETMRGCCLTILTCYPFAPVCADASKYLYFDSIHPGETAYRYVADYFLSKMLID